MPLLESFSLLVGLISQFRAERNAQSQSDFNEFSKWLAETNHEKVIQSLELNTNATIYIKALLNQDHKWLKAKLEKIDAALTAYASSIEGFSELARALNPSATLSDQAISILKQFDASGATKLVKSTTFSGTSYIYIGAKGQLEISDHRFAEDDFSKLVELGLLRHDITSQGNDMYVITRNASELVKSVS